MRRKKMKYIILVMILMLCGGVIIGKVVRKKDIVLCIEEKINIELEKKAHFMEGKYYTDYGDEHVRAKLKLEKKYLNDITEGLKRKLGLPEDKLPGNFERDDIWLDLKENEIVEYYSGMEEGRRAKTIEIQAFIVTDETGEYYLYIFY